MIMLTLLVAVATTVGWWAFEEEEYRPGNMDALAVMVDSVQKRDSVRLEQIALQQKEIAYYLRTHRVTEFGFDIVARYDMNLRAEHDSLTAQDSILNSFWSAGMLQFLVSKSYSVYRKGHLSFENIAQSPWITTICTSDTLPYYVGDVDPFGKRSGFGVDFTPGERMRLGEWRDDKYRGERIAYSTERIYGIDISRYQHEKGRKRFGIDWKNLAITSLGKMTRKTIIGEVNYPISFIYIKSTEGVTVKNRYFPADYANSKKYGYRTGAYHFFSTKTGGTPQAKHFCKFAKYQPGDMPPVLDVEPSDSEIRKMGGAAQMFREIRAWLFYVEKTWHVRPVLYISQTFVKKYLPQAPDLMRAYDVWIARYGEYKPDVNLVYWQLCPDGRVKGIQTEVDINVFNGFEDDFIHF